MTSITSLKNEFAKLRNQLDGKLVEECKTLAENEKKYLDAAQQCEQIYKKEPHRISDIYSICLSCLYGLTDQIRQSCNITLDTLTQSCDYIKNLESEVNLQCLNMDILKERSSRRKIGKLACIKIVDKKSSIVNLKATDTRVKATRLKLRFDAMDKIGCSNIGSVLEVESKPLNEFVYETYNSDCHFKTQEIVPPEVETFNVSYDQVSVFWQNYTKIIDGGRLIDHSMKIAAQESSAPESDYEGIDFLNKADDRPNNGSNSKNKIVFAEELTLPAPISHSAISVSSQSFVNPSSSSSGLDNSLSLNPSQHLKSSDPLTSDVQKTPPSIVPKQRNFSSSSLLRKAVVKFRYDAANADELDLQINDEIHILEEFPDGWSKGILHGKVGFFPNNFVEIL